MSTTPFSSTTNKSITLLFFSIQPNFRLKANLQLQHYLMCLYILQIQQVRPLTCTLLLQHGLLCCSVQLPSGRWMSSVFHLWFPSISVAQLQQHLLFLNCSAFNLRLSHHSNHSHLCFSLLSTASSVLNLGKLPDEIIGLFIFHVLRLT